MSMADSHKALRNAMFSDVPYEYLVLGELTHLFFECLILLPVTIEHMNGAMLTCNHSVLWPHHSYLGTICYSKFRSTASSMFTFWCYDEQSAGGDTKTCTRGGGKGDARIQGHAL